MLELLTFLFICFLFYHVYLSNMYHWCVQGTGVPYKTTNDLSIYLKEEMNCPFYFKKFIEFDKLFWVYTKGSSEKSLTINLTVEEADKVKDACKGISPNYKKPMTGIILSVEVLSLHRAATISNVVPFASWPINLHKYYIHQSHNFQESSANPVIFGFVVWFYTWHCSFEYPKFIQIDNKRPYPVLCKHLSALLGCLLITLKYQNEQWCEND